MNKIKDTKLGGWLKDKAPDVLGLVGELLPDSGGLGIVKNLISKTQIDPVEAQHMIEAEVLFQQEVTKRWEADMSSDVWIAKVIRPYTLVALTVFVFIISVLDSIESIGFDMKDSYVSLFQTLLMVAYGAFFSGRSIEKIKRITTKK